MAKIIRTYVTGSTKGHDGGQSVGGGIQLRVTKKIPGVVQVMKDAPGVFGNACKKVGILPTARQYSKWINDKGLAHKKGR